MVLVLDKKIVKCSFKVVNDTECQVFRGRVHEVGVYDPAAGEGVCAHHRGGAGGRLLGPPPPHTGVQGRTRRQEDQRRPGESVRCRVLLDCTQGIE